VVVGRAVSKAQLDVALRPTEDCWHVNHEEAGIAGLVARLRTIPPPLVVLAATGGLEVPVTGALAAAGRPVVVVHPRPARAFAQATGGWATPATVEARGGAPGAEAVRPTPRPLPAAQAPAWRALLTRRRPLGQRLTAAPRRLPPAPPPRRADSQAHIPWGTRRVARTDAAVAAALHASPRWRATGARLQSPPGVGPSLARTLVAEGPEVGGLNRQESAALRGGAPVPRDRGPWRGTRAVWGGRAPVRAVLSLGPLAAVRHHPVLQAFDARLRAVGTAPQVALTAWMRQRLTSLNARLNHRPPWHQHAATHS
jgi:transposase